MGTLHLILAYNITSVLTSACDGLHSVISMSAQYASPASTFFASPASTAGADVDVSTKSLLALWSYENIFYYKFGLFMQAMYQTNPGGYTTIIIYLLPYGNNGW